VLYGWLLRCDPAVVNCFVKKLGEDMSVNLIFKIAAVGIIVSVLSQVLKHSGREEHAFLLSLAGLMVVLFWVVPYIYELFQTMQSLFTL
jgi:stage III sporulation protein AC